MFLDPKNGRFGGERAGPDFRGLQEALSPDILKGTELEVLNAAPNSATRWVLDNLPTVATQGTPTSIGDPGSCEAESFGYRIGAYTAARKPNGGKKWRARATPTTSRAPPGFTSGSTSISRRRPALPAPCACPTPSS